MHAFLKQANQTTTAKNNNKMADHFVKYQDLPLVSELSRYSEKLASKW